MSSDPASSDKFNLASIPGLPDETLPVLQNLWDPTVGHHRIREK